MATHIDTPIDNKTWLQVVDQAEQTQVDGTRNLTLAYKGETQKIANVCSQIGIGTALSSVEQVLQRTFGEIDDANMDITWTLPSGLVWRLAASEVRQLEAGQYCILKVIYEAVDGSIDPSQPFTKVLEDSVTLSWQSYSVSPYRYCNEREHVDLIVDADGTPEEEADVQAKSSIRRHIEMAFTQNAQNSDSNPYQWEQQNTTRLLTSAEQLIMNKVAAGVNPVFHYPVVQHTRVVETNVSSLTSIVPDVNTGIDVIAQLPENVSAKIDTALVPWTALSGTFVYTGQSVSYTQRKTDVALGEDTTIYTYTFVDTFEGALDPDPNFYGVPGAAAPNDRWEFGVGPQPNPAN